MISQVPIAALKLVLPGEFWDSQLYMGKLYLFTVDGRVHAIEWDRLVEAMPVPEGLALPMQCGFSRSNYLYGNQWNLLYRDRQVRELIQSKFRSLAGFQEGTLIADWQPFVMATHDSPFPFPHADTTIYNNGMFSVSKSGLFILVCRELQLKRNRKRHGDKMWDCPLVSIDASYGALALAAGQEGIFEYELTDWSSSKPREGQRVGSQHCSDCGWVYYSILGSSHEGGGVLLDFVRDRGSLRAESETAAAAPPDAAASWQEAPQLDRHFQRAVSPSEIFHREGYCWGSKDKICLASGGRMSVARYSPWKEGQERLQVLSQISFDPWKGNPVSGAVASFGSIIELEKAIVVVRSDGDIFTIPGEPVNWRVFNRSKQYENQIHIIYEDRLEVFSFNHDYFIDQTEKISGIRVSSNTAFRGPRHPARPQ